MIDTLLNIIAPHVCVVCGEEKGIICDDCGKKCISNDNECFFCNVDVRAGEICEPCKVLFMVTELTSVGWYKDELKVAIYAYKFGSKRGGAKSLARLLAKVGNPAGDCLVTYVPTTAVHVRERGFDHAKLLAQSFAALASLPCIATLARTNNHRQLGGDKKARQSTIVGSFTATHSSLFANKDIILIDDVITTGSTIREATKVLLRAGARRVSVLVVAKTPSKARPNR